jgi:hypothetical protein
LKLLQPEKTEPLFSCLNLQPIRNHFPRSAKLTSRVGGPPTHHAFDPILTSIFKNKEAPLSPWSLIFELRNPFPSVDTIFEFRVLRFDELMVKI